METPPESEADGLLRACGLTQDLDSWYRFFVGSANPSMRGKRTLGHRTGPKWGKAYGSSLRAGSRVVRLVSKIGECNVSSRWVKGVNAACADPDEEPMEADLHSGHI
jgi:hypothetical protein